MDIEKLIERLNQYSQSLIAYKLGADFADACMDAATAITELISRAEAAENRGEMLEYANRILTERITKAEARIERMKSIMRVEGIAVIPGDIAGSKSEWNL